MKPEEFLIPRIMIYHAYPDMTEKVGTIITMDVNETKTLAEFNEPIDKFPNIYRKLAWWEYRTDEELLSVRFLCVYMNPHHGHIFPVRKLILTQTFIPTFAGYELPSFRVMKEKIGNDMTLNRVHPVTQELYEKYHKSHYMPFAEMKRLIG